MSEPTREEVNQMTGPVVLEFGASRRPRCGASRARMADLLAGHPGVRHVGVEDGPGRPLGRSFRVKLWPTLVFLRDGAVLGIAVRPPADEIEAGFAGLTAGAG